MKNMYRNIVQEHLDIATSNILFKFFMHVVMNDHIHSKASIFEKLALILTI